MDKNRLKKHKSNKNRLKRFEDRIQQLCDKDVRVVSGKVTGSSKDFPYTEVRTSVEMYDPEEIDEINRQIREKETDRIKLQHEVDEVDEFICNIKDAEVKEIFEMVYQEGLSQTQAGEKIGYSQGRISQIIADYIKD